MQVRTLPWGKGWLLTAALLSLGLGLRSYHYLRAPSVWHDEAALIVNVLGKDFTQLLGPLYFIEAAPPGFLWLEKSVCLLLGDGVSSLRLVPFLASCLALLLMVPLCRRVLSPQAVPWALLLFACSEQLLWHACEAKPYAVDVLVATVVLLTFVTTRGWSIIRRMVLFTLLAPPIIFLSYPAAFLCGGVLAALFLEVISEKSARTWVAYGLLALTVCVSFLLLLTGPIHAQRANGPIENCWQNLFVPWDQPWLVPGWLGLSTLEVCRYCCKPLGQVLAFVAVVGAVDLWRTGQRGLVLLLVVPVGLALLAACLHSYPYGGTRVMVYAAPALILLIAAGVPPLLAWLRARTSWVGAGALTVLLLLPLHVAIKRVIVPWERADCGGAAEYVLAHRQPTDGVVGNIWQDLYYYRRLGRSFRLPLGALTAPGMSLVPTTGGRSPGYEMQNDVPPPATHRLWILLTALQPELQEACLAAFPPQLWHTVERKEFLLTTVVLVERND